MEVKTVWTNRPDQPLTKPFPATDGWLLCFRRGDLYSPNSWKETTRCYRTYVRWLPRPFIAWRKGRRGFYLGWKVWGCDTEKQIGAIGIAEREVYKGSVAMQGCTIRFSGNVT